MRLQNINNLNTEKDGIKLLRRKVDKFFVPSIEEQLFKTHENYRLCFVHIALDDYVLINYAEYIQLISSKRVQYQITLKTHHG
jgi:hypothetical protein